MLSEDWHDQYDRMLWSFRTFEKLSRPSEHSSEQDGRDALFHFCQDALNLKDWVGTAIADGRSPTSGDLDTLFRETSHSLAVCADIANATKHGKLTRKSYLTGEKSGHAEVTGQGVTLYLPPIEIKVDRETFERIAQNISVTSQDKRVEHHDPPVPPGQTHYHWVVEGDWDAVDFAKQVVLDWEVWLSEHEMI